MALTKISGNVIQSSVNVGVVTASQINVGSAVTIHTGGFRVGSSDLHSTGLTVQNLNATGVVTATSFYGDGTNLTNTGSTLSAASGSQRVVLTGQTSGTMTTSATSSSLTFDASTGILSATKFSGDGSTLTGIAATTNVITNSLVVSGITTVAAGSTSAPSITPTGDSNTGIFFPSADTIAFAEGGVEAARIDSSGRFGIGTNNPEERLHVLAASSSNTTVKVQCTALAAERASVEFFNNAISRGRVGGANDFDGLTLDSSTTESSAVIRFRTGGSSLTEKARIDGSGRLLVGTTSARGNYLFGGSGAKTPFTQIVTQETLFNNGLSITNYSNSGGSPSIPSVLNLAYSRSDTKGTDGIVSNGDTVSCIQMMGNDGTNFISVARIDGVVDGTPGTGDMPGRLVFLTTSDGASTPTERMKIDSAGRVTTPYQPSFFAYLTTTVSNFAPGYSGKVLFSTERFDVGSCYDASNSQFVAPVAGKYFFKVEFYFGFEGTGVRVGHAGWYVNGSITHSANLIGGVTNGGGTQYHPTVISSTILSLSANDYVDFRWGNITGNFTGGYMYAGQQTNFQGFLIG